MRPPSAADIETVLATCPAPMAAILLLAVTGIREMEAVQLERSNLDEKRRYSRLTRTKTNRARTLDWVTSNGDATPLLAAAAEKGFLFPHRDSGTCGNFASAFGAIMRRVVATKAEAKQPFRRWRVHDLRHAFTTEWPKDGGDLYRLSGYLGHTSLTTTQI